MKKIFLFFVLIGLVFAMGSCADSKTFTDKSGKSFTAGPYGWANTDARKIDTVVYEVCVGNVVWSCLLFETVVAPVYFTGWALYEPVRLKNEKDFAGVNPARQ